MFAKWQDRAVWTPFLRLYAAYAPSLTSDELAAFELFEEVGQGDDVT